MKVVSLRALARQAPMLDETVLVSHQGTLIGRFVPLGADDPGAALATARVSGDAPAGHSFGRPRPAPKPGTGH